jgi:hypothetical protein
MAKNETATIKKSQHNLKKGKSLPLYDTDDLKYVRKPIGKAIYNNAILGRPKINEEDKAKPTDRIECKVCGKTFIRSGRTNHNKSEIHKAYLRMDEKLKDFLLNK